MSDPVKTQGAQMPNNPASGGDELFVRAKTVSVRSATNPEESYEVQLPWCPCKGFHFRGECSHVLTAMTKFCGGEYVPKQRISKPA